MEQFLAISSQFLTDVKNQFMTITVSDIIDILVITFLIYRALLLVRRSRGAQVAKAICIFAVILVLSNLLHMNVLNFLLGWAMELGLLALVVIFQPEIRRLLEQMGSSRLGDVFGKEEHTPEIQEAIQETVAAYGSLSKDRVGALMVFERKIPLNDMIKTGTKLDCSVSAELLKNLFWNKAPLHDGAVIVRNGRIVGAGCVLPLSGNTSLSKDLGMRHRAGVGMSENSDAVVVIVSEETGSMAVAVDGMLKRHLTLETLSRLMEKELMPELEPPKPTMLTSLFKVKKGGQDDHEEASRK